MEDPRSDGKLKWEYLLKFHYEFNPIENVWGQAKSYTKMYTNFTLPRLQNIIHPAPDSVSTDLIRKYCRKSMRAYLEGKTAGRVVANALKV